MVPVDQAEWMRQRVENAKALDAAEKEKKEKAGK
jgi:hypothetical protein